MNTNNKEAIELLREVQNGYQPHTYTWNRMERIIALLEDNEDTEVKDIAVKENTCLCKEDNCEYCEGDAYSSTHNFMVSARIKPSSKVEKLKELRQEIKHSDYIYRSDFEKLLSILIEDEE